MLSQNFTQVVSAHILGGTFDNNLNFRHHISQTFHCGFDHIRDFRRIRRYMYFAVAKTIAPTLVSSRLDYCNPLYHNIALRDILRLQRAQNILARVVTRSPRSLSQYHFLNHCSGCLSDIALSLRSVQLSIKHFHPSNQHIYIH